MFVQTEITPNPNSLKFLPGKTVSNEGSFEVTRKDETNNELIRNLLSINGVEGIFLGKEFISINKNEEVSWDEIKHIVISSKPLSKSYVLIKSNDLLISVSLLAFNSQPGKSLQNRSGINTVKLLAANISAYALILASIP